MSSEHEAGPSGMTVVMSQSVTRPQTVYLFSPSCLALWYLT